MSYRYSYMVEGTAADGQTWMVSGTVEMPHAGMFGHAVQDAMQQSFTHLTEGKAVYGEPGKGCNGPYSITRLVVEVGGET